MRLDRTHAGQAQEQRDFGPGDDHEDAGPDGQTAPAGASRAGSEKIAHAHRKKFVRVSIVAGAAVKTVKIRSVIDEGGTASG